MLTDDELGMGFRQGMLRVSSFACADKGGERMVAGNQHHLVAAESLAEKAGDSFDHCRGCSNQALGTHQRPQTNAGRQD